MSNVYTRDGSPELESLISKQMEIIAQEVRRVFVREQDFCALVLGGGYGKGEGGVYQTPDGEKTFNDYDFFVVTRGLNKRNKNKYADILLELNKRLTKEFGIDVDFAFPVNVEEIPKLPPTQMWAELSLANQVILGKVNIAELYPHKDLTKLPTSEARKLLLNRGVGLILSLQRINEILLEAKLHTGENVDFIARNIFKAILGSGDVLLMQNKLFHHSYTERCKIVSNSAIFELKEIELYKSATEFKLHPRTDYTIEKLVELHNHAMDFFVNSYKKFPLESSKVLAISSQLKHIVINLFTFKSLRNISWMNIYPRERIYYTLLWFMGFKDGYTGEDIESALGLPIGTNIEVAYERFYLLWKRFN
jgi:hypothetical protein